MAAVRERGGTNLSSPPGRGDLGGGCAASALPRGAPAVGKLEDLVTSKVPLPMFFPAPSPLPERSRHLWSRENRTLPCRLTRGAVWSPAGQSGQPGLRRRSSVPGGAVHQPPVEAPGWAGRANFRDVTARNVSAQAATWQRVRSNLSPRSPLCSAVPRTNGL